MSHTRKEIASSKILRILANNHAMTIMKIVDENSGIRTSKLLELYRRNSSSNFYTYINELVAFQLLSKTVHNDAERSVTYSVSEFGKRMMLKRDEIRNLVAIQFVL